MKDFLEGKVAADFGDITRQHADAIVNAANSSLMGGGGVDGAIHRAGGPSILEECRKIREAQYPKGLPTGQAVATGAGLLPARYVIHTVGPVWHGGGSNEDGLLEDSYRNSLLEAEKLGCGTIAFPAISTGVYGFPAERAAGIVSGAIKKYFRNGGKIQTIYLIFYSQRDYEIFINNNSF